MSRTVVGERAIGRACHSARLLLLPRHIRKCVNDEYIEVAKKCCLFAHECFGTKLCTSDACGKAALGRRPKPAAQGDPHCPAMPAFGAVL